MKAGKLQRENSLLRFLVCHVILNSINSEKSDVFYDISNEYDITCYPPPATRYPWKSAAGFDVPVVGHRSWTFFINAAFRMKINIVHKRISSVKLQNKNWFLKILQLLLTTRSYL